MFEGLLLLVASVLSVLGMVWLALAMDVHWAQARPLPIQDNTLNNKPPQVALRTAAAVALALCFWVCLLVDRPSIAALVWVMLLIGGALVVAVLLAKRPSLAMRAWPFV